MNARLDPPLSARLQAFAACTQPEQGPMLPPELYRLDPFEQAELMRSWFALGCIHELPEPKSCREQGFGRHSLLHSRDAEGQHHLLRNLCPHRGACILPRGGSQHGRARLTCPYHQWSFELSGERVSAPQLRLHSSQLPAGLERAPASMATPLLLFGNFSSMGRGFEPTHPGYVAALAAFGLEDFELIERRSYEIAANWLLVMENGIDTYHIPGVHPHTLAPYVDKQDRHLHLRAHEGQWVRASYRHLGEDGALSEGHLLTTLNTFVYVMEERYLSASVVLPLDAERSELVHYVLARKGEDSEQLTALCAALDATMREDAALLTDHIQPGTRMRERAGSYLEPDPRPLAHYHQLVARAFTGSPSAPRSPQ